MDQRIKIEELHTPCYVFDVNQLDQQVAKFKNKLPANAHICYAVKANPFLIESLKGKIDYFEICSPGEFEICTRVGVDPKTMIISGVSKTVEEMERVFEYADSQNEFTLESLKHYEILRNLAKSRNQSIRVIPRLSSGNQFGMDRKDIDIIFRSLKDNPLVEVIGIQYFSGTQKKSTNRIHKELELMDDYFDYLKETYNFIPSRLEFGPGLPITYFEDEKDKEDEMIDELVSELKAMRYQGKVVLEMGRVLVANSGYYVSEVVDVKEIEEQNYAIVDGGIHHVTYYGQILGMKKPYVGKTNDHGEEALWNIYGSLCTTSDVLLKQYPFNGLQLGDRLVFSKVGAYAVTEGISLFLSRDLPTVYIYDKENLQVARKSKATYVLNFMEEK